MSENLHEALDPRSAAVLTDENAACDASGSKYQSPTPTFLAGQYS
jgi:hypothetical protein